MPPAFVDDADVDSLKSVTPSKLNRTAPVSMWFTTQPSRFVNIDAQVPANGQTIDVYL